MRCVLGSAFLCACASGGADRPVNELPTTRTVDVVDDYHGTKVADPYRWLEELDSPEVAAWVDAQNAATARVLQAVPARAAIERRLTELMNFPRRSPPERQGKRWVQHRNDGLQNQDVIWIADAPDAEGRVLLDPNKFSDDGKIALGAMSFSDDGRWLAYSINKSGSDWQEWKILDVDNMQTLPDTLEWSKFSGASWTKDASGFFYVRFAAPKPGQELSAISDSPRLCFHKRGTAQKDDTIVYERPDQPRWYLDSNVTDDGRYLVITIGEGTDHRTRVAYVDLAATEQTVRPLLMDGDAGYSFVESQGTRFFFVTDLFAPRGRLIAIDVDKPERASWAEVIPQQPDKLLGVQLVGLRFLAGYLHDAHSVARVHTLDGKLEHELTLPGIGSLGAFTGHPEDMVTFCSFTAFTHPSSVLRYDIAAKQLTETWCPKLAFDPNAYLTKQVFLQSKDGTRVPMFLVHKAGMKLDGRNPTYLYGYGGFDIPITPEFLTSYIAWMERGGVVAVASLRGGSEYGEDWHHAGMLEKKQNVFDDFIAAAEYLIRNRYTRPDRLAIGGGSNGGLLVGAVLTQRPELFGAAIPEVGVMDMLRFHKATVGWAWTTEYGSSDDANMFPVLFRYSPLHNLREGVTYPPTLVMTGDHDDRVVPWHSFKFGATMQRVVHGRSPVLLRIETKAGHGAGTPTHTRIAAAADAWAFLVSTLKIDG